MPAANRTITVPTTIFDDNWTNELDDPLFYTITLFKRYVSRDTFVSCPEKKKHPRYSFGNKTQCRRSRFVITYLVEIIELRRARDNRLPRPGTVTRRCIGIAYPECRVNVGRPTFGRNGCTTINVPARSGDKLERNVRPINTSFT